MGHFATKLHALSTNSEMLPDMSKFMLKNNFFGGWGCGGGWAFPLFVSHSSWFFSSVRPFYVFNTKFNLYLYQSLYQYFLKIIHLLRENTLFSFRESLGEEDKGDSSFGDFPATLPPLATPAANSHPATDVEQKSELNRTNTEESSTESMG